MAASMTKMAKFNSGTLTEEYTAPEMMTKPTVVDLMQNCDLPPPVKLFSWQEKKTGEMIISSDDDKFEILRALRSSQTRAREAERRSVAMAEEKDRLEKTLVEDSMRLFGYRQLVKLLEVQVKIMRSEWRSRPYMIPSDTPEAGGGRWSTVLAVGLGVAGVGLTLCCKYFYF